MAKGKNPGDYQLQFTDEKKSLFIAAIERGNTRANAQRLVGISRATMYRHFKNDPVFLQAVEAAEAGNVDEAWMVLRDRITKDKDTQTAQWWVRNRDPGFKEAPVGIELSGEVDHRISIDMDVNRIAEVLKLLARLVGESGVDGPERIAATRTVIDSEVEPISAQLSPVD